MELTIDQALQKGIEAHKAGKVQEADQYYTAILKANPKHPDANHNMGILAVGVGKIEEALPFLKVALDANRNISQYWISYIDALIKLEKVDAAQAVFNQAKSVGAKGHDFDQIEKQLSLSTFKDPITKGPSQDGLNKLIRLYNENRLHTVFEKTQKLTNQYPNDLTLWNLMGMAAAQIGKLDQAVFAFRKALYIKPDCAEAYNNMGNALQDQGKLDDATEAYNKALSIKPNFADAYNNMGNVLKEQDKLEEAIDSYKKALAIKPDYAEAYNNLGGALKSQGKLEEAIDAHNKALSIKPDYIEVTENLITLKIQLRETIFASRGTSLQSSAFKSALIGRPTYQILKAIFAFLRFDQNSVSKHLDEFSNCDPKKFASLRQKEKVFCSAYKHFLQKLVEIPFENEPTFTDDQNVFHLGESHCLSYAHRHISIQGIDYTIVPRITFGGKAYHFSRTKEDGIKAITKANFDSLPDGSKVFLSFGEIDCRPNEGFISAASKLNRPIESIISDTIDGYVDWFAEQNQIKNHSLFFFNVPAPVYDKKYTAEVNEEVKTTIELFNNLLNKSILNHDFKIIDVYKFTVGHDGFSNGSFHIDNRHLSRNAIPEIEKQIGT